MDVVVTAAVETSKINAGEVWYLTRAASPQFTRPIRVRVIRHRDDWHTYDGWVWIDGYELSREGDAIRRRSLYVRREGVRRLDAPPVPMRRRVRAQAPA